MACSLQLGELALDLLAARGRGVVVLDRELLDLELLDAALDLVDLGRDGGQLDADARGGLVDQVDRLVGEEAVGDVAVAEHRGGDQRGVGDADAVVRLVALLEPAQDRDRVLDRRLADVDRLEAPLERRVLLDVLLVLVERGGADRAQLAAGEHRLEQVGGVDGALGGAGADDRVQLVHEQDDLAVGLLDLLEDGLQALLELAAVLGAGDQRADVERDDAAVLELLRHVAGDDALGEALGDRGLADAGLADQDGVVLGAAGEDLDDAADLVVAADDRVELAVLGGLREVAAELLERLVLVLGVLVGHAVRAADGLDRLDDVLLARAVAAQRLAGGGLVVGEREQQVLGRDVLVLELAPARARRRAGRRRARGASGRLGGRALDGRELVERGVDVVADGLRAGAELVEDRDDDAVLLLEQDGEQVLGRGLGVVARGGERAGGLERGAGLGREAIDVHRLKISVGGTEIIAEDRRRFQSVVLPWPRPLPAAAVSAPPPAAVVVDGRDRGAGPAVAVGCGVAVGFGCALPLLRLRASASAVGVRVAVAFGASSLRRR